MDPLPAIITAVAQFLFSLAPLHAQGTNAVPQKEMAQKLSAALCSRMAACDLFGGGTKEECLQEGSASGGSHDVVPKITARELDACVRAIERLDCETMRHSKDPPKPCAFMKGM